MAHGQNATATSQGNNGFTDSCGATGGAGIALEFKLIN
jgi:hypothetical protein